MSNNVILTPNVYAKLTLFSLGSNLKLVKNMSTKVTPEFARKDYKIGSLVEVRKPYRFVGGEGIEFDPEPIVDQVTPVKVSQVSHVHLLMDSVEKTLDLREAMELYTDPTGISLASKINARGATFAANNALSAVGTPGTAPTSEASYLAAGDRIVELGLPEGEELSLFVNRRMSTAFVSGTKTLFNPTGSISAQWNSGVIEPSLGYKIMRDQTIDVRTNGTFAGSIVVSTAGQVADGGNNATMTLTISGFTGTFKKGDRFTVGSASSATVGGINSVHPQTRIDTGSQQVFTLVQDSAANATTIVVSPAITPSGQYQNVTASNVTNAILTVISGTTGQTGITSGILAHKNAFAFVSLPMWNPPKSGVIASEVITDPETGLSINYVIYLDGDKRQEKHRFDCLYDFASLYKELACVVYG